MRIDTAIFTDPGRNAAFGTAAVALSMFVFAYSTLFGQISILAFYACWLPLPVLAPQVFVAGAQRVVPLLVLPGLCALSVLWSDRPDVTLRAAIQYGSTVVCGLIAARVLAPQTLALGGLVGSVLVLGYSWANGHYAYDVVDGTYAFAGAFASKNQLGYFASLGVIFALAALVLFETGTGWKLLAATVAAWALATLAIADSATSTLTLAGTVAVIATARVLFALGPGERRVAIAALAILVLALALVAWRVGVFAGLLEIFGRDPTLTGRTYLWHEALEAGSRNPLIGLGYYAFWTVGRPHAEQLWEDFYIGGKTGFHFHNTLAEAYVGLGLVGLVAVGLMTLALLVLALRVLLNRRRVGEAALAVGLAVLFVVRSTVEIDFFTPYTAGSFLVPFLLLQMADQRAAEVAEIRQAARPYGGRAPGGFAGGA